MIEVSTAYSRRQFLAQAGGFGAFYSLVAAIPLPALATSIMDDPHIAQNSGGGCRVCPQHWA